MQNQKNLKLTLPFPPSINHYWRHTAINRKPRVYLSAEGLAYRATVAALLANAMPTPLVGRIKVVMRMYAPNKRRYDIDNRVKAVLDALTHAGLWADDEQVDDLHLIRGDVVKDGQLMIEISEIDIND